MLGNRLSVVVLTHNRVTELRRTLRHLQAMPERPPIVVVDNASSDATATMVETEFPSVTLLRSKRNIGAAARNLGVEHVRSRYVAFCDDDTWWAPGSLLQAAELFDDYSRVAVLNGRVLIGEEERDDPTCSRMAASCLPSDNLPGRAILGFMAGAVVVRREAYLQAGGYEPNFFIGGEEALLAIDLAMMEWKMVYVPQLRIHHHPSGQRDVAACRALLARNAVWTAWLRRPFASALRETGAILRGARQDRIFWRTCLDAARGLHWVAMRRRPMPAEIDRLYRHLAAGDRPQLD